MISKKALKPDTLEFSKDSTTIFKRNDESTSVSSFNEDSTCSDGHNFVKKGRKKKRNAMEFCVPKKQDVSPVRTRSQRNNLLQKFEKK